MNKKGFTLVELLAVIVIMAVIISIGTYGVVAVRTQIKKDLWDSKVKLIEQRAVAFGEDNKNRLTDPCTVDGQYYSKCMEITVQTLIDRTYLSTKEKNDAGDKVITNDTLDKDDTNYYVNKYNITIYLDNNRVYAKLDRP